MVRKIILVFSIFMIIAAGATWYYVFEYSKNHHRDVVTEDAIVVSADKLTKDFLTNETTGNSRYLNKAVLVNGVVLSRNKDQAGQITVTLKGTDAMTSVLCTLKPAIKSLPKDSSITIKGICTGFLSDVVVNEAVIVVK